MRVTRLKSALVGTAALASTLVVGIPAASAHVICDGGEFYRVTSHSGHFTQVGAAQAVNKHSGTATLHVTVGSSHTSSRSFTKSISGSVEGGFWVFAKVSASGSAGVTLEKSATMTASFGVDVPVPGHSTRTVAFGFRRYSQTIQRYHLYNNTISTCARHVDNSGTVVAPYATTFIIE